MDRDADALYGLPRDEFILRRGELAKSLRKDGRREEATAVAALRKPSVAAWAVNQLVRTQRSSVQELLDAGDALRDAQSDLLAGEGDGRALRAASDRERAAVEDLVERARGLLSAAGDELSPAVIERVAETLHAAALEDAARDLVRDGRLERELRHAGLGLGLGESGLIAPEPRRARPRVAEASTTQSPEADRAGPAGRSAGAQRPAAKPKREPAESKGARAKREGESDEPKGAEAKREHGAAKREGESVEPKGAEAKRDHGTAKRAGEPSESKGAKAKRDHGTAKREREPVETKRGEAKRERELAEAKRAAAEQERRERAAAAKAARAVEVAAKRRADVAARALAAAETARDDAAQALSTAEAALDAVRKDAASTSAALERAQAEREDAERRRKG